MLLKNAQVLDFALSTVGEQDLRIDKDTVLERGTNLRTYGDEELIDLRGKVLMAGHVCAHTHLYSSLARGMPGPGRSPQNFEQILKRIWWKLDEALDEETIWFSALVGAIDAVKHGTTTLIDHHASPNCIPGSLEIINKAMEKVGVRAVLCYETTDRGGRKRARAGIAENERFVHEHRSHPLVRGLVGAHASFTLSDATLTALGHIVQESASGIHIHCAEDRIDVQDSRGRRHDVVRRLEQAGVLTATSVLAHGVHLTRRNLSAIRDSRAWLVHNPRSNMNNSVGHAPLDFFPQRVALGTDGFPADMFEEARAGYLRCAESPHRRSALRVPAFLHAGNTLVGEIFSRPIGTLQPGSVADLVVLSYVPPTPITSANVRSHVLFGINSAHVESVMVQGKWILWKREVKSVDEQFIMAEARTVADRLWKMIS